MQAGWQEFKDTKCYKGLLICFNFIIPLQNDVNKIQAIYDNSVSAFFDFMQQSLFVTFLDIAI